MKKYFIIIYVIALLYSCSKTSDGENNTSTSKQTDIIKVKYIVRDARKLYNFSIDGENITIDWGDGHVTTPATPKSMGDDYYNHTYESSMQNNETNDLYEIKIEGTNITHFIYDGLYNYISAIDVSKNPSLTHLMCTIDPNSGAKSSTKLSLLDISKNPELSYLDIENQNISDLDLSKNPKLDTFNCNFNPFKKLDVTQNLNLKYLTYYGVGLPSVDLTKCKQLTHLDCGNNKITSLIISENINLQYLAVTYNDLKSIDFKNNSLLKTFLCGNNFLTSLDLSNKSKLEGIGCNDNPLSSLNVQNSNIINSINCQNTNFSNGSRDQFFASLHNKAWSLGGKIYFSYGDASWYIVPRTKGWTIFYENQYGQPQKADGLFPN